MKFKNNRELIGKHLDGKSCVAIYKAIGDKMYMIWEAIKSCFSKGWNNHFGWNNDDGWNND